jgi:hypothetical protein
MAPPHFRPEDVQDFALVAQVARHQRLYVGAADSVPAVTPVSAAATNERYARLEPGGCSLYVTFRLLAATPDTCPLAPEVSALGRRV